MHTYSIELTDTFGGEANYSWVRRVDVLMPELTHYGYDGCYGFTRANKTFQRELMRRAKKAVNLTGVRGTLEDFGDSFTFRPYKACMVMFVSYKDD